jgi:hypothetical protein
MKTNDEKVMQLKKQIEEKKSKLKKNEKFAPITNCSIELDGARLNLNVLNKEQLLYILVKLNMYNMSCKDLGVFDTFQISGYLVGDWMNDVKSKLEILSIKEEENKLKAMENKLTQLLSEDKKVELELDEIANLLK